MGSKTFIDRISTMNKKVFDLTHKQYASVLETLEPSPDASNDNDEGIAWHNEIIKALQEKHQNTKIKMELIK
jgi:hypothetical protein